MLRNLALAVGLLLCVAACSGGHHSGSASPLPTVQDTGGGFFDPDDNWIVCHDMNGVQPDRRINVERHNLPPTYCFICGECYYNCPR